LSPPGIPLTGIMRTLKNMLYPRRGFLYGDLNSYGDLVADEYVDHLRFVIGGWAFEGNVRAFECCVRNMPADTSMVEIGSFLGLSTNIIAYAAHKYGRTNPFFTCDPWVFAGSDRLKAGYFSTATKLYRDWAMEIFKMNISVFSPTFAPHTIETFSSRFFELWQSGAMVTDLLGHETQLGGPIGFAYVDGDHTYEGAKQDFLNIDRFLAAGGYVLLDDSSDDSRYEGLKQLVREIADRPDYTLVLKAPNYCFKKK
jgi:hypothetical protein